MPTTGSSSAKPNSARTPRSATSTKLGRIDAVVDDADLVVRVAEFVHKIPPLCLGDTEIAARPTGQRAVDRAAHRSARHERASVVYPLDRVLDAGNAGGNSAQGFGVITLHHYDVGPRAPHHHDQFDQRAHRLPLVQAQCHRFDPGGGQR